MFRASVTPVISTQKCNYSLPLFMCRWSVLIIVQRGATQSSVFIVLQAESTCFGRQPHPIISTQNCNYSLRYWSYFLRSYLPPTWPSLAMLEGGSCSTGGCSYSFVYWWWVWLKPETCRVNLSQYLTNLMHKTCFTISFFMPLHVSSTCAHHQEVKIALYTLWYHQVWWWW